MSDSITCMSVIGAGNTTPKMVNSREIIEIKLVNSGNFVNGLDKISVGRAFIKSKDLVNR